MFDKYTTVSQQPVNNRCHTEVHEHRAPTDDSIRIYHELVEKARNEVIAHGDISDNALSAKWTVFQDAMQLATVCKCRFVLNGRVCIIDVPLEYRWKYTTKSVNALGDELIRRIVNAVGVALAIPLVTDHQQEIRNA